MKPSISMHFLIQTKKVKETKFSQRNEYKQMVHQFTTFYHQQLNQLVKEIDEHHLNIKDIALNNNNNNKHNQNAGFYNQLWLK